MKWQPLGSGDWLYTEGLSNRFNILSMVEEDFLLLEKEVANMKWEEARMTPVVSLRKYSRKLGEKKKKIRQISTRVRGCIFMC